MDGWMDGNMECHLQCIAHNVSQPLLPLSFLFFFPFKLLREPFCFSFFSPKSMNELKVRPRGGNALSFTQITVARHHEC